MPNKFISVIRMENVLLFQVCVPQLPSNPQLNSLGKANCMQLIHTHIAYEYLCIWIKIDFTDPIEMNVKV